MPPKIGKNEQRAADDAHSIAARRRKAPGDPDALGKPDQAALQKEQGKPEVHGKAGKSTS
jgi:hypothetical protein